MPASAGPARLILYAVLGSFALLFLGPTVLIVLTSFKDLDDLRRGNMLGLPAPWTLAPWAKAWSGACTGVNCAGLRPYFMNSVVMVVPAVLISTLVGSLNGYILAQFRFRFSDVVFTMFTLGFFVPFQAILLPAARFLALFGLANTIPGLVVIHVVYGLAFTTMLFRNFYIALPPELVKAARVDGASVLTIYRRVFLPLSLPITMVSLIWQFTQIWNDFLFGIVFSGPDARPVTVALNNLVNTSEGVREFNVDMAAALITALPTLAVYVIGGRYFVRGLTAGAVKG